MLDLLVCHTRKNIRDSYGWLLSLLKIGCIGFGGGNALLPVIEQEAVNNDKLVSKEEYDEDVIVASITPGALTVKISAAIGRRIMGTKGMFLAAFCMGVPGFVATVLMASVLSKLNDFILRQVEFISIGITAFILSGLFQYIKETVTEREESTNITGVIVIIITVFFLSCGKNVCNIIGISKTPVFAVSTINILVIAFFIIFYTNCKFNVFNSIVSFFISVAYLVCVGSGNINDNIYIILQITMLILSCFGIIKSIDRTTKLKKISMKSLIFEIGTGFIFLIVVLIPAVIISFDALDFVWKGFLSCIISFGGGDGYLTIADGIFVSSGMISYDEFYGHLIIVANALPGSILCKVLSGIGYYIGLGISGSALVGYIFAFVGFACSVVASCGIFSLVNFIFHRFKSIKAFQILRRWIRTIISGLLANVILYLVYQCIKVASSCSINLIWALLELAVLYVANRYIANTKRVGMGNRVIIISTAASIFGNIALKCM